MKEAAVRATLLGFAVPEEIIRDTLAEDPGMPVQTHTFAWALVNALLSAGKRVTLLSTMPVSTYPRNRRVRFKGRRFKSDGVEGELLGFVNLLGIKHATRFLSACVVGTPAVVRWNSQVLLVHGVHAPFLWFGVLVKCLRGITLIPVLTDPPGVNSPGDGPLTRFLRRVDVFVVKSALRRCDGVVAMTRALAEDFAPGRPQLLMDGILNLSHLGAFDGDEIRSRAGDTFDVVYAGGLSRAYGVDRLVEAVRGLEGPAIRLLTFGRGELEPWLREQSIKDRRICPPEFLSRGELAHRLARADVLVNPRPIDQSFVNYSFPSKILEYLSAGAPVVTTRLPGIPGDYDGRLLFTESDTVEGIRAAISCVMNMSPEAAGALGAAGATFVRETRSAEAQGARIRSFLSDLVHRETHAQTEP
jgi:glycosyltransferase involved in cell wall biosynthesis